VIHTMIVNKWKEKETKKQNIHKRFAMLKINHYNFDGDRGGGGVMMVVVVDDQCLHMLLPVHHHEQHGGMLMEVLVDRENENIQDTMIRE